MLTPEETMIRPSSPAATPTRWLGFRRRWADGLAALGLCAALYLLLQSAYPHFGWGGDYAGYLDQARSVAEGRSLRESNYVYNPSLPQLAPPAYPLGLPLVLAPVYACYGLDHGMLVYARISIAMWWLAGVALFVVLRRQFAPAIAFTASVFFLFNPYTFNDMIVPLPDYLFCALTLGSIYWYGYRDETRWKNAVITGLLAGAAWLFRANGVVLLLAMAIDALWRQLRHRKPDWRAWGPLYYFAVCGAVAAGLNLLVHRVLWPLPTTGSYLDQVPNLADVIGVIRRMLDTHLALMLNYFQLEKEMTFFRIENLDIAVRIGGALALGLALFGVLLVPGDRMARFTRLYLALFMIVLSTFQWAYGIRYLVPVFALLIYHLLRTLQYIDLQNRWRNAAKWALIPLLLYGAYWRLDQRMAEIWRHDDGLGSPHHALQQEAYRYVRENTAPAAQFAYHQPLLLGLFCDRKCMRWTIRQSPDVMEAEFRQFGVEYILINNWKLDNDEDLKKFFKEKAGTLTAVWQNEHNVLYKFNDTLTPTEPADKQ
jgi:hypothetical protein